MKQRVLAATLAAALTSGATVPAMAGGWAVARDVIAIGAGAGLLITNYNHKVHQKRLEQQEVKRRQEAYRDWFHDKYGYYPTHDQFRQWYVQTYRRDPG